MSLHVDISRIIRLNVQHSLTSNSGNMLDDRARDRSRDRARDRSAEGGRNGGHLHNSIPTCILGFAFTMFSHYVQHLTWAA